MMASLRNSFSSMADNVLSRQSTVPPYNQKYLDAPDDLKDAVHSWESGVRDTITYVSNGKSEFSSKNISILSVVRKLGTVSSNFET